MAEAKSTTKLPTQASSEIGASGTNYFKGYITAEEYSIDLQGKYGLQVYDVMRKSDPTIHAVLTAIKQPILGADWTIQSASSEPADQEIADRANYEFFNRKLVFPDSMREGLSFLDFGFYCAEIVYEGAEWQGKPYIGIKKLASRKQRSILKWELENNQPGIVQMLPSGKQAEIPRNKILHVANDQEGENYFGFSLLRYAYKPWKIKDGLEIMNAVALENMALGVPYIKKGVDGQSIDEAELKILRDRLRQHRVNEEAFLEFPASVDVGWMDMKSQSTKDVLPTIQYQDSQILLSTLTQFLLLGQSGSSGSRAVSADHSRLFVKSLIAVARYWQQSFQRDVLDQWVDLNYSNLPNGYPKLVFSTISDEDIVEMSTAVSNLMSAGALTADRDVENRIRTLLNLPPLDDDTYDHYDELKQPPTPVVDPSKPDPSGKPGKPSSDVEPEDPNEAVEASAVRHAKKARARLIQDILARE